jgi:D-glycero-alpha-D-manno-heptose-7-phosphate kinase
LSATIDHAAHVSLAPRQDRQVRIRSLDLGHLVEYGLERGPQYDGVMDLPKAAIERMGVSTGMDVDIASDAPPGSGSGGSSALVTACVGALAMLTERSMAPREVAELAYAIEREDLGIAGGWQDQLASAFGGFNLLEFDQVGATVHPLALAPEAVAELRSHLLLCYTGHVRTDLGLIDAQIRMLRGGREDTIVGMKQLQAMAFEMRREIEAGNVDASRADAPRGVREQEADEPARLRGHADRPPARRWRGPRGASGGKICGAGGGGYLLLACTPERQPAVRSALEALGGQFTRVRVPAPTACEARAGVRVWRTRMSRRFVCSDRDGTINEEVGYVLRPDELRLIPGAADALRRAAGSGLGLVVLTNQSRSAAGCSPSVELDGIHARLRELLAADGVTLDGIEFCPAPAGRGLRVPQARHAHGRARGRALGFDPARSGSSATTAPTSPGAGGGRSDDPRPHRPRGGGARARRGRGGRPRRGRPPRGRLRHPRRPAPGGAGTFPMDAFGRAPRPEHWACSREPGPACAGTCSRPRARPRAPRRVWASRSSARPPRSSSPCARGGSSCCAATAAAPAMRSTWRPSSSARSRSTAARDAIPAIALTTDTSLLTAVANDYGFEHVFARQVEALGREGDVLIGISTSGKSANVVKAFERARAAGLRTIALTGGSGGGLGPLADIEINVPSSETSHIQEAHIAVGQLIAFLVEDELFPR